MTTEYLALHLIRQVEKSQLFFWHRLRWKMVGRTLPKTGPFRMLDVGAGAGLFGAYLKKDFPGAAYGFIEPIPELCRILRDHYGAENDYSSAADYTDFPYVILMDVLEHQEKDGEFLNQIAEKMADGAQLLITVPAFQFFWTTWDEKLGHHRRYTKKTMRALLEDIPLETVEMSYLFPEMAPLAMIRKWTRGTKTSNDGKEDVEFPDLPDWLNQILTALGSVSLLMRRFFPFGTSLFVCLKKNSRQASR